ncbi:MAG: M23 family metallopeptidase [Bacteroidales bacterium]|nr:M23 family metallopeptidase [Bacteroidales bacterium]
MASGKYIYNSDTQSYEPHKVPFKAHLRSIALSAALGLVLCAAYVLVVNNILGVPSLKQMVLENNNSLLADMINHAGQRVAPQQERLEELQMRDNTVYRPIFGMDELPTEVRDAGYDAPDRYAGFAKYRSAETLEKSASRQDVIEMRTYLQSKSYDDIEKVAMRMEDMAKCVPSLMPVCPGKGIQITSPFGYRLHPVFGYVIFHSGTDIAGPKGTPIYAAADGVVREVRYNYHGYGNVIDIDHGFGYSTRYGHLDGANVEPGQVVHRGDQIATMGRSGRATGPHLHYEVLYKNHQVNPWNYFDKTIPAKTYMTMVTPAPKAATSKSSKK